jgi:serine O-acetyltransferase
MLDIIKADLYRYQGKSYNIRNLLNGFRSQGFSYMFFRRLKDHYGTKSPIGFLSAVFLRHYTYKYGFQIGGKIGKGFYIGHFGTIIVSRNAIIGENCNIAPGVTIGVTRRGGKKGAPQIGSFVWIGTNSVIVGNIKIANNVLIAPGSYVNFDVPENSIVLGNPGLIKPSIEATKGYINNIYVQPI